MKALEVIFDLIIGTGNFIYKLAIVIIVGVAIWAVVSTCASNATLSEHSSCQQFEQADTSTQDKVLQQMMSAHNDRGSLSLTRFSLTLYCNTHDPNSPIDGIYSSGNADRQSVPALYMSRSTLSGLF